MSAEDNERWRNAVSEFERRRAEQAQAENQNTIWISFHWVVKGLRKIFSRKPRR